MITWRAAILLSAFACVSAQAQDCSGGAGGGTDATGNQCGVTANDRDSGSTAAVYARPAVAIAATTPSRATPTGSRTAGTNAASLQTASAGAPASRFPVKAKPAAEPTHTAKIGDAREPLCSGGIDGGMDATGNQCNPAESAGAVVVAQAR